METSETIGAIAAAMAKAQGEMKAAVKGSDNPFFKSKYADLHSCFDAIRDAYSKHGIAVIQSASVDDQWFVNVTTMLAHSSGEWIKDTLALPVGKKDAQGVGACVTYGRRFQLAAMTGLSQADDDGEGVVDRTKDSSSTPAPKKKSTIPAKRVNEVCEQINGAAQVEFLQGLWAELSNDERSHARIAAAKESAKQRLNGGAA